ncbi:MAG: hypothetical protein QXO70_00520, partial [Candidatus Pacearchaeota archaeon]
MVFKKREQKYHLTKDEEFQILKLILDKYLWIGTIALIYGIFLLLNKNTDVKLGIIVTLIGATVLLIFTAILGKDLNYK